MLDQALVFVQNSLMAQASLVAMVLEIALRLVKSDKPRSLLLAVSGILHKVSAIAEGIAKFMDRVIPQNLK